MADRSRTAGPARGIDNVDSWRGPTASQAAGLTLAAARAVIAAVQAEARSLGVAMSCLRNSRGAESMRLACATT